MRIRTIFKIWIIWALTWGIIIFGISHAKSTKLKAFVAEAKPITGKIVRIDSEVRARVKSETRSANSRSRPMVEDIMYWRMAIDYELNGVKKTFLSPMKTKMPDGITGDPIDLLISDKGNQVMLKQTVEEQLNDKFFLVGWICMSVFPVLAFAFMLPFLWLCAKLFKPLHGRLGVKATARPNEQGI